MQFGGEFQQVHVAMIHFNSVHDPSRTHNPMHMIYAVYDLTITSDALSVAILLCWPGCENNGRCLEGNICDCGAISFIGDTCQTSGAFLSAHIATQREHSH